VTDDGVLFQLDVPRVGWGDGCALSSRIDSARVLKRRRVELISGPPFDLRTLFRASVHQRSFLYSESLNGFLVQKKGASVVTAFHTTRWPGLGAWPRSFWPEVYVVAGCGQTWQRKQIIGFGM
jgi:hypothetical protein